MTLFILLTISTSVSNILHSSFKRKKKKFNLVFIQYEDINLKNIYTY